MDFDAQPSSSSSSSLSNVQVKMNNQDITEDGQVEKKLKNESKSESENQVMEVEAEVEDKCFIDELPPEMLTEILKCLDVTSLVNCRLVSRKWNGIAREIIQSNDDVETAFYCRKTEDGKPKIGGRFRRTEITSLGNFMKHFEDSTESPLYTRFRFYHIEPTVFECEDWTKFLSDFGPSIKCLRFQALEAQDKSVDYVKELAGKWRHVLVNQLPQLEEFGLTFTWSLGRNPPRNKRGIQLFPTIKNPKSKKNKETVRIVELPHLKVLYLDEKSFSDFPGIVTDLLRAAINLQKIDAYPSYDRPPFGKTFELLHSVGRLHCIQDVSIHLNADFVSKVKGKSSIPLALKLKKLSLTEFQVHKSEALWSDASDFLSNLFESSKDTLTDLKMPPLGFLPGLQVPKFSKLTQWYTYHYYEEIIPVLPSGLDLNTSFPVLQNLQLRVPWTSFSPAGENISGLPNLKTLKLSRTGTTKEDIAWISQVCPNLKELQIYDGFSQRPIENFPEVGAAIWTHLTKLESLKLEIFLGSPANSISAIDSTFTGFPGEYYSRLHDLIQGEELLEKSGWEHQKIQISRSELEAERKSPSILDLKDLIKLTVFLSCAKRTPVLFNKMLIVSEKYVFKLMENLSYKIQKCEPLE